MKISSLFLLIALLIFNLTSCSNTNYNNQKNKNKINISEEKNKIEEQKSPIAFEAFGKTYTSSKDISLIDIGNDVYYNQKGIAYTYGEYKEIDFIYDILYSYLNEDSSVYDYLVSYDSHSSKGFIHITEKDKNNLIKDLNSLRSQMELIPGESMYVKLDKVTYEGPDKETNSGLTFKVRVAISKIGSTSVPWNYFTVTVFEDGNKLLAHLF